MRIWLALLASPSLALACQSILFALVTPACEAQSRAALHGVGAAFLLVSAIFTALAFGRAHGGGSLVRGVDDDVADPGVNRHFLAVVAAAVGAMSSLVILMMWVAAWVLSPCS